MFLRGYFYLSFAPNCSVFICNCRQPAFSSLPASTFAQVHIARKAGLNTAYSSHTRTSPQPVYKFKHSICLFLFPTDCQITLFFFCISFEGPPDQTSSPQRSSPVLYNVLAFPSYFLQLNSSKVISTPLLC